MTNRKKLALLLLLVAVLVGVNVFWPSAPSTSGIMAGSGSQSHLAGFHSSARIPDGILQVEFLEPTTRVGAGDIRRNIFEYARVQSPPRQMRRAEPAPPASPRPVPRPPLRFFGLAEGGGGSQQRVLLTDGEEIYVAAQGDVLLGRYRVTQVDRESLVLEDLEQDRRWVLPLEQP